MCMLLHIQKLGTRNAVLFGHLYYSQNIIWFTYDDKITACVIWGNARLNPEI